MKFSSERIKNENISVINLTNAEKTDNQVKDLKSNSEYPSFSKQLQPQFIKFSNIFPQFPKTHPNGYATVIELNNTILNHKALHTLKKGCQYSTLSHEHGFRPKHHIPFFTNLQNENGTMLYSYRRCAGVKACEFLAEELRVSHNEVNDDGLEWVRLLAKQELSEANTFEQKLMYYSKHILTRLVLVLLSAPVNLIVAVLPFTLLREV